MNQKDSATIMNDENVKINERPAEDCSLSDAVNWFPSYPVERNSQLLEVEELVKRMQESKRDARR